MTISREVTELIAATGPKYPNFMTVGSPESVKFSSATDGTTTIVQIVLYGEPIGTGIAKRRKGDARNDQLGLTIALLRAFTDATMKYANTLDGMLNAPEDPSAKHVKSLRQATRKGRALAKANRRKAARDRFRALNGWDHTDFPEERAFEHALTKSIQHAIRRRSE